MKSDRFDGFLNNWFFNFGLSHTLSLRVLHPNFDAFRSNQHFNFSRGFLLLVNWGCFVFFLYLCALFTLTFLLATDRSFPQYSAVGIFGGWFIEVFEEVVVAATWSGLGQKMIQQFFLIVGCYWHEILVDDAVLSVTRLPLCLEGDFFLERQLQQPQLFGTLGCWKRSGSFGSVLFSK